MSSLRKPAVGPIVGHTTSNSCRLWIAAGDTTTNIDRAEDRRTIGVLGVYDKKTQCVLPEHVYYFRLKREYDRTGTFNLGKDVSLWVKENEKGKPFPLKPASTYRVRMSTLTLDDSFENDSIVSSEYVAKRLPDPGVWASALSVKKELYVEAEFTTAKEVKTKKQPVSFLLGSCRYPGVMWKKKEADRIFGPMFAMRDQIDFTMMVGDQIYADLFNRMVSAGLADTYEEFQERYHTAFTSPNMSALVSRVPVYMTLDDHEIEDNWTQDRVKKSSEKRKLFNLAIGFYMNYQWSHGPRFADSYVHGRDMKGDDKYLTREPITRLFYDFNRAGYPFFVLDSRTQRYKNENTDGILAGVAGKVKEFFTDEDKLLDNHMLGRPGLHPAEPTQIDYLCAWLRHMQEDHGNVPKFIATSSVFVPNDVNSTQGPNQKEKSDSWDAFPNTRRAVLKTMVDHGVQNVIFLSGDIHCANMAELTFTGKGKDLTCYSVTSSAFYWPFPFADGNPADYVHDSKDPRTLDTFEITKHDKMDYTAWSFTQADNFAHVSVNPDTHELIVQLYGSDGQALETVKRNGKVSSKPEVLKLAKW